MCNGDCNQGRNCDCKDDDTDVLLGTLMGLVGAAFVLIAFCFLMGVLLFVCES